MDLHNTEIFKAGIALSNDDLYRRAPSIFATGPMQGVSNRYTFVPTASILGGLRDHGWVPVEVEEQRIRKEARRGFQKHMIRLRLSEQMQTLDEWNVELVVLNSHDTGCAYQLHAGIYRRICENGLVLSEGSFEAIRFRHSGCLSDEVVQASFRLIDLIPKVGSLVQRFRERALDTRESMAFADMALLLRYPTVAEAPVDANTLLKARRPEDEGSDLWNTLNRVQENLVRGGVSDIRHDRRGHLRSVRTLRGIDSKVTINKGLWSLAEQVADGTLLSSGESTALSA